MCREGTVRWRVFLGSSKPREGILPPSLELLSSCSTSRCCRAPTALIAASRSCQDAFYLLGEEAGGCWKPDHSSVKPAAIPPSTATQQTLPLLHHQHQNGRREGSSIAGTWWKLALTLFKVFRIRSSVPCSLHRDEAPTTCCRPSQSLFIRSMKAI